MKSYFRPLMIAAGMSATLAASAQSVQPSRADADWLTLMSLAGPAPQGANSSGLGQLNNPVAQQAEQFENASQFAKAFCAAYPTDPFASAARKLEVAMALQGAQLDGLPYQEQALTLSVAYLANPNNSPRDRFDVALTAAVLSPGLQGKTFPYDAAPLVSLADSLHGEFGELPDVYGLYLSIMRTADPIDALALARKLIAMKPPAGVAAEAKNTVDRTAQIGTALDLPLTSIDGKLIDWTSPQQPTVIYVWSNRIGTGDLAPLSLVKSSIPEGVRVVYISLQSNLSTAAAAMAQAPVAGIFHFEHAGLDGLTARTLKIQQYPCVYVLTPGGTIAGFGRVEDLPALLAVAGN
jgi:hypothetical protein